MTAVDTNLERYLSQYRKGRLDSGYYDAEASDEASPPAASYQHSRSQSHPQPQPQSQWAPHPPLTPPQAPYTPIAESESEFGGIDPFYLPPLAQKPSAYVRLSNQPGRAEMAPLSPPVSMPPESEYTQRRSSFQRGLSLMGVDDTDIEEEDEDEAKWDHQPLNQPSRQSMPVPFAIRGPNGEMLSPGGSIATMGLPTPVATPAPEAEGKKYELVDDAVLGREMEGLRLSFAAKETTGEGKRLSVNTTAGSPVEKTKSEDMTPPTTPTKTKPTSLASASITPATNHPNPPTRKPSYTPYPPVDLVARVDGSAALSEPESEESLRRKRESAMGDVDGVPGQSSAEARNAEVKWKNAKTGGFRARMRRILRKFVR